MQKQKVTSIFQKYFQFYKKVSTFTLEYRDQKLETAFNLYKQQEQEVNFYIKLSADIIINASLLGTNFNGDILWFNLGFLVAWLLLTVLASFRAILRPYTNFFTMLGQLALLEYSQNILYSKTLAQFSAGTAFNQLLERQNSITTLLYMITIASVLNFQSYWQQLIANTFTLTVVLVCALLNFNTFPWQQFLFFMMLYSALYIHQLQKRFEFSRLHNIKQNLQQYERVLRQDLPMGIFVMQKTDQNQISFSLINEQCLSQFQLNDRIEGSNSNSEELPQRRLLTVIENTLIKQVLKQPLINQEQKHIMSLAQHIRQQLDNFEKQLQNQVSSKKSATTSFYNVKIKTSSFEQQCFDISLVNFVWEERASVMVIAANVSDREHALILRQMDKQKDDTLAMVSHDLKAPLSGIASLLESSNFFEKIEEHRAVLPLLKSAVSGLRQQIKDIQDYSLIKNGKFTLHVTRFDLLQQVEEVLALCRPLLPVQDDSSKEAQRTVQLCLHQSDQTTCFVENDQLRFKQVLYNLVSNSIKYTREGSVNVIVTDFDDELLRIKVSDTGLGMSDEIIQQLFRPYATFYHNEGVGLGLVICRKLVGYLGPYNNIVTKSKSGKGSEFSFLLYKKNLNVEVGKEFLMRARDQTPQSQQPDSKIQYSKNSTRHNMLRGNATPNCRTHGREQLLMCEQNDKEESFLFTIKKTKSEKNKATAQQLQNLSDSKVHQMFNLSQRDIIVNSPRLLQEQNNIQEQDEIMQASINLKSAGLSVRERGYTRNKSKSLFNQSIVSEDQESLGRQDAKIMIPHTSLQIGNTMQKLDRLDSVANLEILQPSQQLLPPHRIITVLLVDDQDFNLTAMRKTLQRVLLPEQMQLKVYGAANGREALEIVKNPQNKVDVIFMDLHMPVMQGDQALLEIRQLQQRGYIQPSTIVIVTAEDDVQVSQNLLSNGADKVVEKPAGIEVFQQVLMEKLKLKILDTV